MRRFILTIFLISLFLPGVVLADEFKGGDAVSDVIDVDADLLEVFTGKGKAVFTGDVNARRTDMVLKSQVLILYFDDKTKKVNRLVARDSVYILWQDKEATCDEAEYIMNEEKFILTGNVEVKRGEERLAGEKITVDMKSDHQVVEGDGSRVRMRVNTGGESGLLEWEK